MEFENGTQKLVELHWYEATELVVKSTKSNDFYKKP